MTNSRTVFRFALLALGLLGILVIQGARVTSAASPTDLFISEYIEGSSNNKALEIYNGTGASVDLGAGVYNVQIFANGSGTAGTTINLTGTVANGDVFVLAHASANATILGQADQTSTAGLWNGNDAIVLRKGTTVIDSLGVVGSDPGAGGWGTDPTNTTDNTLQRKSSVCAGDTIVDDAFDPATEWNGFAIDTFTGLGSHTATCSGGGGGITLSINDVTQAEGNAGTTTFTFTVSLSAAAPAGGVTFDIATADNTAVAPGDYTSKSLTGQTIPEGSSTYSFSVLVNGDTDIEANETFFVNVTNLTGTGVTIADGQGLGTINNDDVSAVKIHDVQGNGATSPMVGQLVSIEGIVVGDYQDKTSEPPNELNGFVVQEEDADVDADPNTSEGVFVFQGANPSAGLLVSVGDKVQVTGTVSEFGDAADGTYTQISGSLTVNIVSSGNTLPTATTINLPVASLADYEKYESMLVTFPQELTVTEIFTLGRYGEVLLSAGGRLQIPTHAAEPGAAAAAVEADNILRSILLDDGLTNQNPDPVIYPAPELSALNTLRGGDTTTGLTGVMHYLDTTEEFRVQPVGTVTWDHENPRPEDPPDVGGTLKVASFNVLNYFITLNSRGANSAEEFERQHDKIVSAIATMDADIVGLIELENNSGANPANNGVDPVLQSLVDGLNDVMGVGTYAFIDTGVIGTDEIKQAFIYKPATVTPVGAFALLDDDFDPDYNDGSNRPALAQTFQEIASGEKVTVVVNHLKSKGSPCGAPDDQPDSGGGNCNGTRTAAAEVMVDWLATDPTSSGDPDFLIIGDLNSYAKEDPIDALVAGGYTDLATTAKWVSGPYSYVFDGEWGYLDYGVSGETLTPQVAGAGAWHINADEPIVLDYNTEFKNSGQIAAFYDDGPYRASDHDPIIVGLNLGEPDDTTPPTTTILTGPLGPTTNPDASFTFTGNDDIDGEAVTFECQLDGGGWTACTSPQAYTGLSVGNHTFEVRAKDSAGNYDPSPATWIWEIVADEPPSDQYYLVTTTAAGTVDGLPFDKNDILMYDGEEWSVYFDGAAAGLPAKADLTAIHAFAPFDILMTFKQNKVAIPGYGQVLGQDIVAYNLGTWYSYFDGSDVGLTTSGEKLDSIHVLPGSAAPVEGCIDYLLISIRGTGKVPAYGGGNIKVSGEDVLGFCATSLGDNTQGSWHMVLDGSAEGVKKNAIESISANEDGTQIYLTTKAAFNVDSAVGGHSMVYVFDTVTGEFSGPIFSAPAEGLNKKVDGLHVGFIVD